MRTQDFRTKTEFIGRDNGHIPGVWEIAMDIGYSAVKTFSPNSVNSFPMYARRVDEDFQFARNAPKDAILYRDLQDGDTWLVGRLAQDTMETGDTTDSETALYSRDRYDTPIFKVALNAGLGVSMIKNEFGAPGSDRVVIQTGLPERYMNDKIDIQEAFAGSHDFEIKVGTDGWRKFSINLGMDDVSVMSQPRGTLFSVCIGKDGQFLPDARKYLSSSVLVFDPGFGTLDLFPILSGVVGKGETFSDLGMKRVFQETSRLIYEQYGVEVPVPSMQRCLSTGMVTVVDKKALRSDEYDFTGLLEKASNKVCDLAIERMMNTVQMGDYKYLIITGGTGQAWMNMIKNKFRNFTTLTLIEGNQNDDLSTIYSNVRGYYLYRYNKLGREMRENA